MRLNNKIALVTGAGSGIGAAICLAFVEQGATVIASDIDLASVQNLAKDLNSAGHPGRCYGEHQDVTNEQTWTSIIDTICERHNHIDILVNNAGIVITDTVEDASLQDWRKTQEINLESVFMGTQAAIKKMKAKGGSIVNISSIEGMIGEPLAAAYNASKGGVRILTKSSALHCAASNYNIRVNSVHPGYIATPLVAGALDGLDSDTAAAFHQRIIDNIPLGELGDPRDIALAVVYVASDEARYMTGSELVVDGGYTAA